MKQFQVSCFYFTGKCPFFLLCKHHFHPLASRVKVATTIHVVPFSRLYVVTKLPSFFPFCFSSWKTLKRLCCCLKNFKRRMSSKSGTKRSSVLQVHTSAGSGPDFFGLERAQQYRLRARASSGLTLFQIFGIGRVQAFNQTLCSGSGFMCRAFRAFRA